MRKGEDADADAPVHIAALRKGRHREREEKQVRHRESVPTPYAELTRLREERSVGIVGCQAMSLRSDRVPLHSCR